MLYISHRGNIDGKNETLENKPSYVDSAISNGYDVEVDVWWFDNQLWLGHDKPQYNVNFRWFHDRISKLWIHCKSVDTVIYFKECEYEFNFFWHENDTITLTSLNNIWAYPGKQPIKNSISVMPEIYDDNVSECLGICSDVISKYKKTPTF